MIGMLGPEDLAIVIIIAVVLFGGKKIPELARSLGRAKSEFHKGLKEGDAAKHEAEAPSDKKES